MNKSTYLFLNNTDWLSMTERHIHINPEDKNDDLNTLIAALFIDEKDIKKDNSPDYFSDAELVKKYFHNPIGILPYFPPKKD